MKTGLLGVLAGASAAYVLCALLGAQARPTLGPAMTPAQAAAALAFAFSDAGPAPDVWADPAGHTMHGWLFRRGYVTGRLGSEPAVAYSEQVLKVGWPFTVVRGFVRTVGSQVRLDGALVLDATAPTTARRLVPLQPVWPGLGLSWLLGAIVCVMVERRRRPGGSSHQAA